MFDHQPESPKADPSGRNIADRVRAGVCLQQGCFGGFRLVPDQLGYPL